MSHILDSSRIIALSPAGIRDPAIAIAASRAGAIGVLDFELESDIAIVVRTLGMTEQCRANPVGVRLAGYDAEFCDAVVAELPESVRTVLLSTGFDESVAAPVRRMKSAGKRVLFEVSCEREARHAVELEADGLVVKGSESGGWGGEETAFVLAQRIRSIGLPRFIQGGVGLHTVAACVTAGAEGVVLDSQLLLTRESPLPDRVKLAISRMDGTETVRTGEMLGAPCRVYAQAGRAQRDMLVRSEQALLDADCTDSERAARWRREMRAHLGWGAQDSTVWPIGQDACFAKSLADRFVTVSGVIAAMCSAVESHLAAAREIRPLAENSALAVAHHTRFPIVQGPMTRVSDRAEFALDVANAGALPFIALALMRAEDVERVLAETADKLGDHSWGVGMLGFVPPELRQEQLAVMRRFRPKFALIAGGRPDQAQELEQDGTATYLHVPSTGLLRLFLEQGARSFVFEGRECGGHVGPLSSFVLWDSMIDLLLSELPQQALSQCRVLFAGGIHDGASAAMVAAMAGRLAAQGVSIGVLMGTAYLYTREAVTSGAILQGFQDEAIECERTVLLESGAGHATRCAETDFAQVFQTEKQRMLKEGKSAEELRMALEAMNIGRLRIASKGVDRNPAAKTDPNAPSLVEVGRTQQRQQGLYMLGQIAALRSSVCTMEELHREVSEGCLRELQAVHAFVDVTRPVEEQAQPAQIAIIGMSTILPGARRLADYWTNIVNNRSAIGEIPKERWDWSLYFDADPAAKDKIYSKWGGFIDAIEFDPAEYGMPPNSLRSIDPMQLLALQAAQEALEDAAYGTRPFDRSRTSVILGASGGIGELGGSYVLRSGLTMVLGETAADVIDAQKGALPEWSEDSFAGLLLNVAAGRIANRLDLGGVNYIVDAACASSLAAVHQAVRELETVNSDMVIVGGVDTTQNPFGYLCFSKTRALSPKGQPRTFDANGDGIVISEGVTMLVLKRLADAERDGDRIYAVIQGVGGASDGRAKGMTAPRPEGQIRALKRAYRKAGIAPDTVDLFEAHGTGTVVGDQAEAESLSRFLTQAGTPPSSAAVGSVKSMIGHTKATAGVAGLAKVALALHQRVLPPTHGVSMPNPKAGFGTGPLYVNSEARPWLHGGGSHPRRAGVSAFGFGGTNFHAVLEEYQGALRPAEQLATWPSELFLFSGSDQELLRAEVSRFQRSLDADGAVSLGELAYRRWSKSPPEGEAGSCRLAIVARSVADLKEKLAEVEGRLAESPASSFEHPSGMFFEASTAQGAAAEVAFLFPGQGSQYPNMVKDLAIYFDEVRETFERADAWLAERMPHRLSSFVFPPPAFSDDQKRQQQEALKSTDIAQPAIGVASAALLRLLNRLNVRARFAAGHSYGEYVALFAAQVFGEKELVEISEARGRSIIEAAAGELGAMSAVMAGADETREALGDLDGVWLANFNAPRQTIISGTRSGIEAAGSVLREKGLEVHSIPVGCAFHSPLVAPAKTVLAEFLSKVTFGAPQIEVYSNNLAAAYPSEPDRVRGLLSEHLVNPVRFTDEIEAMHQAGARLFVEVGPNNKLTGMVKQILADRPHTAVALDVNGQSGLTRLQQALAQLYIRGVPIELDCFFERRSALLLKLQGASSLANAKRAASTAWFVDGGRAWPARTDGPAKLRPVTLKLESRASSIPVHRPADQAAAEISSSATARPQTTTTSPSARSSERIIPPMSSPPFSSSGPGQSPASDIQASTLVSPASNAAAIAQVMSQYQALMGSFLETQRNVMLTYLEGSPGSIPTAVQGALSNLPVVDQPAVPPAGVLRPEMGRADADVAASYHSAEEPAPVSAEDELQSVQPVESAAAAGSFDPATVTAKLVDIVSERTGYPVEMLDLDLDLEADLGVDSIKRVEILGSFQQSFGLEELGGADGLMERLTAAKTLRDIVGRIVERGPASSDSAAGPSADPGGVRPVPKAPTTLDQQQLTSRLLEIVSERTGYPAEMLDLDLDLEADLGIDSIKRVEILGTYQRQLFGDAEIASADGLMETLSGAKSLREIVASITERIGAVGKVAGAASTEAEDHQPPFPVAGFSGSEARHETTIGRFRMELVDAPIHQRPTTLATDRIVLITDDGCGIAAALTAELQKRGVRVVLLECGSELAARGDDRFVVDLTAPGSVADLIDVVRNRFGSIGMILHLLPLKTSSAFSDIDFDTWRERLRLDVKSLFYLTKAAASDLQDSSADGACVLAASHIGLGRPGGDASSTLFPGHKGLNGFLKTLALEWPGVRAKAVDLDAEAPVEQAARQLMEEILSGDLLVEVSYDGDRRLTPTIRAADLAGRPPAGIPLESSSVVLITGGARGVTAKVARLLAEHYQPTLILAGRSPLPVPEEAAKTAGITEAKELKAALMSMMREKGEKVVPATVEKAYARLIADREMRSNMEKMRRLGADVHYFPVDVRDAEAFGGLIDQVYESFGRLDGVVHGAGVIEDKLIVDKTAESFDRTFDTKTDSAFVLSRKLRPATLRFLVLFSSVAGSFGNRGQSDYAAANEVLNQLARQLDAAWSARVVSINWGPWDTPGMVSPELRKQFAVRGVELIPPDVGLRMFEQELACGNKGESQVIVGGAGWGIAAAKAGASQRQLPLTTSATASRVNGHYEVIRELDPANDIYLLDHRIDGKPVLPLAVATELIAETVAMGWPDRVVTAVEDLYMLKGLVMDAGVTAVRVVAEAQSTADTTRERVIVQIQGAEEPRRAHYRAVVEISDRLPHPPALERINLGSRVFAYSVPELYQNWLFHGPSFQGIAAIDAIGPLGVRARLKASVPSSFFARPVTGEWLIDPLVFDSGLQLLILWSRDQWDMTTLPSRFRCYRRYGVAGAGPAFCEVAIRPETSMPTIHADIFFRDSNGSVIGVLEDMEGSSSTTLNRLVGVRSPAIESGR